MARFLLLIVLLLYGFAIFTYRGGGPLAEPRHDLYLKQLGNDDTVPQQIRVDYQNRNNAIGAGVLALAATGLLGGLVVYQARSRQSSRAGASGSSLGSKPDSSPEL